MPTGTLPTIKEVAVAAGLSYWTIKRYGRKGIIALYRDAAGRWRCEPGAAAKAKRHYRAHGAPGGRPLR